MSFKLVCDEETIDVHDDPPGLWRRVAVIGGWQDARITRKRWPQAAVVGPLRTVRGIDRFVRNLLANPQIRAVIWDGPDLTPGEETKKALFGEWALQTKPSTLKADIQALAGALFTDVELVTLDEWNVGTNTLNPHMGEGDRPGGTHILPPPAPVVEAAAPAGDPGERVAGETLAEVWPRVLEAAMGFGRTEPTQYGPSREVLCLTSVIRDPVKTLNDIDRNLLNAPGGTVENTTAKKHAVLGISGEEVSLYYQRLTKDWLPQGAEYTYGSRMRGSGGVHPVGQHAYPDQKRNAHEMMMVDPSTRAAYMTPWRPDQDGWKFDGTPCLVGVWFRAQDVQGQVRETNIEQTDFQPRGTLNMVVAFRAHDLFGAYKLNIAGLCHWLVDEASQLGMAVGSLTCTSYSAHVYERDYTEAAAIVKANPRAPLSWDQRSTWIVSRTPSWDAEGFGIPDAQRAYTATAYTPDGKSVIGVHSARTTEALLLQIHRSGLVTDVQHGMWLGVQLARLEQA